MAQRMSDISWGSGEKCEELCNIDKAGDGADENPLKRKECKEVSSAF